MRGVTGSRSNLSVCVALHCVASRCIAASFVAQPYTHTLHQIAHKQTLVRAYAWTLFGHSSLARLHTRSLLSLSYSAAEDWALAVARECLDCCFSKGNKSATGSHGDFCGCCPTDEQNGRSSGVVTAACF